MCQWPRPQPGQLKRERTAPDCLDNDTDAKEATRQIYDHTDPELAEQWIDELVRDCCERSVRSVFCAH